MASRKKLLHMSKKDLIKQCKQQGLATNGCSSKMDLIQLLLPNSEVEKKKRKSNKQRNKKAKRSYPTPKPPKYRPYISPYTSKQRKENDENKDDEKSVDIAKIKKLAADKTFKDYDNYCELLVYGYCRTKLSNDIPSDLLRLCLLWFNPNTICLSCRSNATKYCMRIIVNPKERIFDIKFQIEQQHGVPVEAQSLWLPSLGKLLRDDLTVHAYDLHDNDALLLRVDMGTVQRNNQT